MEEIDLQILGEEEKGGSNLWNIVSLFRKRWKWIVLGVIVALVLTFIYLRYTTPVYNVGTTIILKEEQQGGTSRSIGALDELAMLGAVTNVDNEIFILQSRSLIRSVINRLSLHTSYIVKGRIKETDLYTTSPVVVAMNQADQDQLTADIELEMQLREDSAVHVRGELESQAIDTLLTRLPALIPTQHGNITFTRRAGAKPDYRELRVLIQHSTAVIRNYRGNLTVSQTSKSASVLKMDLKTPYPLKGRDFLATLVEVYNNDAIEDKNQEAINTQRFIDERIAIIDQELGVAERNVEEYKQAQGLTDIQTDLQRDMQMGSVYEQQLVEVETQLNVVNSLDDYLSDPTNQNKTIPSNIGVDDPTLQATTSEYNRLLLERERLSQSMTDDNPAMRRINEQIQGLRQSIGSSINSVQQGLQIRQRETRNQANLFGGRVSNVPTQEREFMELSREQQIKASLFLMLLQKREENALALAAFANKAKVLDEPANEGKVAPKTMVITLASLLFGLLIPMMIIYLKDLLSFRITSRSDVDKISKLPILGDIPTSDEESNMAVKENETRPIDEAFRMLRTNLLLALGADNKVVVFTSTVAGEGKTFVALNTAISLSLLNKKVLLVGLDLRLPRLSDYLKLETKNGITNYLSGFETDLNSLIVPSKLTTNLFVLPAGPIPPNPAELLSRPSLDKAIGKLKEEYDLIIIDSSPASQVTDTLIINRVSDATVYMCRANYSSKGNLRYANELRQQKKLKNMVLVVNDVDEFHHGYGYGYGYGYGRSYGYGYKDKKNKKKRLLNRRASK